MRKDELILRLQKFYRPGNLVKEGLKLGEIPDTRAAYGSVISIAWASVAEAFLVSMISMADTLMVSVVGDEAIAAVGLVTQPRFLVQTLVIALNMSVVSITARRKGERDTIGASACLKQGLVLSLLLSLVFSALVTPFSGQILRFAGAHDDSIGMAKAYFDILIRGIPLCNLSLTISAALRGTGNTKASMAINMTSNVVNLIFNYLLIGGRFGFPALGVPGAAIATVIGWGVGLLLALRFVLHRDGFLSIRSKFGWKPERAMLSSMFKVASGSLVEQLCMRAGFLTYGIIIARLGTIVYATHQILANILSLSFSFGEGYGIAASSLVGQNLGAKRPDLSIVYGKICQRLSLITSTAVFALLTLFGRNMLRAFSDNPQIIKTGSDILLLMVIIIYGQASQLIFMGALRGAGDTRYTAAVSLVSITFIRPVVSLLLAYGLGLGLFGAWIAFVADQYTRLVLTYRRFSSGKWVTIKL
ncbi:MAG: MATE family efflux transporter [Clostridiales bacterium]|jgi:putative MATE family efflux protein|nr:MATE family efflux transporter [Clostridiales bacterium]